MTLIFSFVSHRYVLQVSDRQVTLGIDVFDSASNKTIVYGARDALVVISYAGLAYLHGVTTDRWIAECLRGQPVVERLPGKPSTLTLGRLEPWLDLGRSLRKLRNRLEQECSHLGRSEEPPQLSICGWQRTGKHWRPISISLGRASHSSTEYVIERVPRLVYWETNFDSKALPKFGEERILPRVWSLLRIPEGALFNRDELQKLVKRIWEGDGNPRTVLYELRGAITQVASRSPLVGSDCLAVFLPYPSRPVVEGVFLSERAHSARIGLQREADYVPIVFTPWVVGPHQTLAPSLAAGSMFQIPLGHGTFIMESPESVAGLSLLASQLRPLYP